MSKRGNTQKSIQRHRINLIIIMERNYEREKYYQENDLETRTEVTPDGFHQMWGVKYNHVHNDAMDTIHA